MIRKANLEDVNNLIIIFDEYKNDFNKLYDVQSLIESLYEEIYIYEINEKIVGFIIIERTYETISILHIFVLGNYRRQSIASMLIDYIFSEENNVNNFILEVDVNNTPAIKLYQKLGFEVINKRKKYYNNNQDAYVMEKKVEYE